MNNYPKLHNATWPGIVGKGPDSEPPISLDTLLELTANAEVDGVKFDGIDLGLFEPHFDIDASDDGIKKIAEKNIQKSAKQTLTVSLNFAKTKSKYLKVVAHHLTIPEGFNGEGKPAWIFIDEIAID